MVHIFWKKTVLAIGAVLGLAFIPTLIGQFAAFPLLTQSILVPQITIANIVGVMVGLWVGEMIVARMR